MKNIWGVIIGVVFPCVVLGFICCIVFAGVIRKFVYFLYIFVYWPRVYVLVIYMGYYYHVCFLAEAGRPRSFRVYYGGRYLIWVINRGVTI